MIDWVSVEDSGMSDAVKNGQRVLVRLSDGDVIFAYFAKGFFYSCVTTCEISDGCPITHYSEINQPGE